MKNRFTDLNDPEIRPTIKLVAKLQDRAGKAKRRAKA